MRRVILFPLLLVVSPIVWVVHHMLGGNKSAERRAIQYVQKHIGWYTDRWHTTCSLVCQSCKTAADSARCMQARIEAIDSVLQRPIRTPLGIMTAADYKRLILLRLERNYYARLYVIEKPPQPAPAPAQQPSLAWLLGSPSGNPVQDQGHKPAPSLYDLYNTPRESQQQRMGIAQQGNVTHQIQQPNPFQ